MSLKLEDLKVGDELVFTDLDGFENNKDCDHDILMKERIIITSFNRGEIHLEGNDGCWILESELKYFKKKEQSQYTFDDLIDVVSQAFKDKRIFSYGVTIVGISIRFFDESETLFTLKDIKSGVEFIQSLYKETFVIECEEDIKRIKAGAKITLNNSNLLTVKNTYFIVEDRISIDAYTDECTTCQNLNRNIGIVFLKGAIVEQERGRDD